MNRTNEAAASAAAKPLPEGDVAERDATGRYRAPVSQEDAGFRPAAAPREVLASGYGVEALRADV